MWSRHSSFRETVAWGFIWAYLAFVTLYAWEPSPFALWLAGGGVVCAFIHCALS